MQMIKFYIVLCGFIIGLAHAASSPYDAARHGDLSALRQYRFDGIDLFVPDERGFIPYELAAFFADPDKPDTLREQVEIMLWLKEYHPQKHRYGKASTALVQAGLNALGYPVGTPDGIMGKKTAEAIRLYQKDNKLAETGRLGPQWLGAFYQDIIKDMQFKLTQLGYNTYGTDGMLGKKTRKAMLGYRFDEKLPTPEYEHLDASLLNRLTQAYNGREAKRKAALAKKVQDAKVKKIRYAQAGLRTLGYRVGKVDGVYGSKTANAIKKFQKKYRLPVSGSIDKKTYAKMHSKFLQETQRKLGYLGYKAGKPDGKMGKRTAAAIRKYSKAKKLSGSGVSADLIMSVDDNFDIASAKYLANKRSVAKKAASKKKTNTKPKTKTKKRPSKDVVKASTAKKTGSKKKNSVAKVTSGGRTSAIKGNNINGRMLFKRQSGRVVGCSIAGHNIPIEWCEPFYPLPKNNHCEAMFKPSSGAVINLWCK